MGQGIFVAMTGASGSVYGLRLIEELVKAGVMVTATASPSGVLVCREETGLDLSGRIDDAGNQLRSKVCASAEQLRFVAHDNLFYSAASGSAAPDAMVIAPCSMGTVARVACGISSNLIERVADVMLKERKPLLLVPRETPLSEIHLENLLKLSRAGARIIPAMPAFYHHPEHISDLVDFVVGKVLDQLGVANDLFKRWG